ncbi:MAG: RpiB/LacA/LacB family sugar-phosphate isomerase [Candidatus Andersenbacteria bacterium]|nr:RpiB/LacA/LacB family sugar-phosphate isomerase [Candidatus Andersenbacteria bacterium]
MKVFLAADHRGFTLKEELKSWLEEEGREVVDLGAESLVEDDDYSQYGIKLGEAVEAEPGSFGVGVCGSGIGMAVAANKVRSVRAGLVHDVEIVKIGRSDDNMNVLALGADFISLEQAKEVVRVFLDTAFVNNERHQRRLNEISAYECRDVL